MDKYFKLIEQKRQQKNIKINELCKIADIEPATYYNAKSCRSKLAYDKFIKLCIAVGIKKLNLE
jgi:hypothetical protein